MKNIVWTDREEIFYLLLRGVDEGIMKVSCIKIQTREKNKKKVKSDACVGVEYFFL